MYWSDKTRLQLAYFSKILKMKNGIILYLRIISLGLIYLSVSTGLAQTASAKAELDSNTPQLLETSRIIINSYGFNAKKRSGFILSGQMEQVERGITIIHFNSTEKIEYRTFDTYSTEEACSELIDLLGRMNENKTTFAILAHDSASNSYLKQSQKLLKMGLPGLSNLKSRQAYIMHNFGGQIYENIDDISTTITLEIPTSILDQNEYFPKIHYEFEPSNDRYIAHAGGEVNGIKSTNTKEALDQNYERGFRLFELDLIKTSDDKLVAAHDWKMWARFTDYKGVLPPSHEEFMKYKIYGEYTTMDMKGINNWFAKHPDAILVTDKLNDPLAFANAFLDKNRLIMELFSVMAIEEASKNDIKAMISQEALMNISGDKFNFLAVNDVKYVAVSRRIIANQTKLLLKLKAQGLKVYVYNVNFDAGKDEKYVQENEIGLVYGMYADKWIFGKNKEKLSK